MSQPAPVCTCRIIQAEDPARHFTGCACRELLPVGHPAAVAEAALRVAIEIEAEHTAHPEWVKLTVAEAWHGCNSALDDAKTSQGAKDEPYYLTRLAGWALVMMRAGARERAAQVQP